MAYSTEQTGRLHRWIDATSLVALGIAFASTVCAPMMQYVWRSSPSAISRLLDSRIADPCGAVSLSTEKVRRLDRDRHIGVLHLESLALLIRRG